MKRLLLLLSFLSAYNVRAQRVIESEKATDYSTYIKGNNFEGAIFSESYNFNRFLNFQGKRFTPSIKEIILVEKLLQKKLDTCNNSWRQSVFVHRHIRKYIRQYFGYINDKGEKIIYINAFIRNAEFTPEKLWRKDIVMVMDGGNSYWDIKVNLSTQQLFAFGVHGDA